MNDPASRAAIERVAAGDHSMDAIAQLLLVLVSCQQSTNDKVAALVAQQEERKVSSPALAKYVLWIILGLVAILAGVLRISLPFLGN